MARKLMKCGSVIAASLVGFAGVAAGQDAAAQPVGLWAGLLPGVVGSLIYSALGLVILLLGFKAFDWATPFSLNKEIAEDNNVAAGVVVAGIMIGLGLIVASAIA